MEENERRLASKSFGDLLSDGFRLFGRNYAKIILPFGIFLVLAIVLDAFIFTAVRWELTAQFGSIEEITQRFLEDPYGVSDEELDRYMDYQLMYIGISILSSIIQEVFRILAVCCVSMFLYKQYRRQNPEFFEEFQGAFNKKLILPILILGVITPIGLAFLIIPGAIVFLFFIFLVYTYNMEEVESPIRKARSLMKGSSFQILGILLISIIIPTLIDLVYMSILDIAWQVDTSNWQAPGTRNYGMIILYNLVYSIVGILFAPLFICLLTPLFAQQQIKKSFEGTYSYERQYAPRYGGAYESPYRAPEPPREGYAIPEAAKPIPKEEGFYCPFCGYKIPTPKKFCPNCGESLEELNKFKEGV